MALKVPLEAFNLSPEDPAEARTGITGYLQNARDMIFGNDPGAALMPFIAPLGMAKIPKETLDAVINARGKLFHGTHSLEDVLRIISEEGLRAGPQGRARISTSRSPHVSKRFGPFILEINPEMVRSRPIAEPGFRKSNPYSFEAEEGITKAPAEAIDKIYVDKNHLNNLFKGSRGTVPSKYLRRDREMYERLIDFASANNIPVVPIDPKETKLSKLVNTKTPGIVPKRGSPIAKRPKDLKSNMEAAYYELAGAKPGLQSAMENMDTYLSQQKPFNVAGAFQEEGQKLIGSNDLDKIDIPTYKDFKKFKFEDVINEIGVNPNEGWPGVVDALSVTPDNNYVKNVTKGLIDNPHVPYSIKQKLLDHQDLKIDPLVEDVINNGDLQLAKHLHSNLKDFGLSKADKNALIQYIGFGEKIKPAPGEEF